MSTEGKMTVDERRKYLRRMKQRHLQADRREKGRLLDEMQIVTELHRKSLIRLLKGTLETSASPGRELGRTLSRAAQAPPQATTAHLRPGGFVLRGLDGSAEPRA